MPVTIRTVIGRVLDPSQQPTLDGEYRFTPTHKLTGTAGDLIPARYVAAPFTAAGGGSFSVDLIANDSDDISPPGTTYRVDLFLASKPGRVMDTFNVTVPKAGTGDIELGDLVPVAQAGEVFLYLTQSVADNLYVRPADIADVVRDGDLASVASLAADAGSAAASAGSAAAAAASAASTAVGTATAASSAAAAAAAAAADADGKATTAAAVAAAASTVAAAAATPATVAASAAVREAFLPATGQFELQPMWVTGHSWVAVDSNATPGARWYQRLARRIGIAGTPTNKAQSGRTICDVATASLSGSLGWVPRTRAFVAMVCTINDITIFDGSAASRRGYNHAWRALLSQITANAAVAANTTSFAYSSGWASQAVAVTTGQASNTNSTGGTQFRTTTVGSYFDFTMSGPSVDVFLVARAAGAGLVTFTVGGTTVGTLDLTLAVGQDCPAVAQLRGLGSGTHTVRGTLTSGASATVDSIRIPSTGPTVGIVLGEPDVIPTGLDHATYLADQAAFKSDLAAIVATFPTFSYIDLNGPAWDKPSMLTDDGKHPNDKGCAHIASRCLPVVAALPYSAGLNQISDSATVGTYSSPTGPAVPSGGVDGTGAGAPAAPGQVTGLTLVPGSGSITASWTAATNAPTDYVLQVRTNAGPGAWQTFADGTSPATSAVITGLTNGTAYDVQVAAVNATGQGAYSAAATATPLVTASVNISDTFNRADGALAGSTTTTGNKTWANIGGTFPTIVSQQVKAAAGGTSNGGATVDTTLASGDVQATLVSRSGVLTTMISGLMLRYTDDSNNLTVQIRKASNDNNGPGMRWALVERIANTPTVIAFATNAIPTNGDVVKVELRGNTARVLVNGVEVIPSTTLSLTSGTRHGFYMNAGDTVTVWDDWAFVQA